MKSLYKYLNFTFKLDIRIDLFLKYTIHLTNKKLPSLKNFFSRTNEKKCF